jgi:hypothetical protein
MTEALDAVSAEDAEDLTLLRRKLVGSVAAEFREIIP